MRGIFVWSLWFQEVTVRWRLFSKLNHRRCNNKIGFPEGKKKATTESPYWINTEYFLIIKKFHIKLHVHISRGGNTQDKERELEIIMAKLRFQACQQWTEGLDMNNRCRDHRGPCKSTPYASLCLELCLEPCAGSGDFPTILFLIFFFPVQVNQTTKERCFHTISMMDVQDQNSLAIWCISQF